MTSFLGTKAKEITDITDEVIINNMFYGATAAANAYLNATLTSSTPELRAMYSTNLTQVMSGHSAIVELAITNGWENPYNSPATQLAETYDRSKDVVRGND